jgi:hypothetical protein
MPDDLAMPTSGRPLRVCWALAGAWLVFLGGCSTSMAEKLTSFQNEPVERAPRGRIMQGDVDALNEAVAAIARTEDPRRFEDASKRLASLLPRFEAAGENALAAQTLFWLAYCYEKTGRKDDAAVFYDQIIRKYPETRVAEQAKSRRQEITPSRAPAPPS